MPIYSHSRLATYETCPLQYKYSYVEKVELEPEVETIEAFMGSRGARDAGEALKLGEELERGRKIDSWN